MANPSDLKILIADDHPIFRNGVKDILTAHLENVIITAVADGKIAWQEIKDHAPEIAVLDVDMPEMDGLEVCKKINKSDLPTRVIILTMYKDLEIFNSAIANGAKGFLLKDHSGLDMVECIKKVLTGEVYIGKGLEDRMGGHSEYLKRIKKLESSLETLTAAELKTLKLVQKNNTSKEIAHKLFVTQKTVENYRSRICKKLNIPGGNNALIRWVMDNKDLLKELK